MMIVRKASQVREIYKKKKKMYIISATVVSDRGRHPRFGERFVRRILWNTEERETEDLESLSEGLI